MSKEVLDENTKKELAKTIILNGGEVNDGDFKELENYLILNPKGSEIKYLDN